MNPVVQGAQRNIFEIPVTVGFNRRNFDFLNKVYKVFSSSLLEPLRFIGILWHTGLLRKIYFSPEMISGEKMRPLIDSVLNNNYPVIHMYLHSSSLIDKSTGLMNQKNSLEIISRNIRDAVHYISKKANIKFCTITEASTIMQHRHQNP